ncbi:CDP-2,3-bis-(O-geranylgeranyl)-sn-glycerol synthase [Patescibacteria group bacterium]|nr:CDP-2,3-bis-(O-geranylgeranyl)-sn-glycerol synthase [Patescibacteria group bacterium]MBU1921707.1 CDP-2,3-bis-(O-geranylgeranyl)-sn-glycerol synthase [Patescibacteria group bacterium]
MYLLFILKAFYFALPAYLANMSPVIFDKLGLFKFLKIPIDFGKKLHNKPILGKGKTWRGLILGILVAMAAAEIQKYLFGYAQFEQISVVNFASVNYALFGFLAGAGALLGDMVKSFIKRRVGIASGRPWPVFDQLDFICGFMLFTYFIAKPDIPTIIAVFVITLILHPLTNIIGYALKFKKVWW